MSSFGESLQKIRDRLGAISKKGGDSATGGASKFDAKLAIAWVKKNPVIVTSVLVMLAAPAAAWWFSSEMHAEADKQTAERAKEMAQLERLEKTDVEIALPGQAPLQQSGVVTPKMVAAYEDLTGKLRDDAIAVQKAARAHNQKHRTALAVDIQVKPDNVNTIATHVYDTLKESIKTILTEVRAGSPPDEDRVLDQVQRRQDQFVNGAQKTDRKSLTEAELDTLHHALADKRLQVYADAASNISFYADMSTLGLPSSAAEAGEPGKPPPSGRFFYWQWRCWIVEDLLRAFANANKPFRSVTEAPVKRLVSIQFLDPEVLVTPGPAAGAAAAAVDPNAAAPAAAAAPVASLPPIDPKLAVPYNFGRTFTGRQSNSLYDVRLCRVRLVVSTRGLPEVLNAIARENFMTVTDMKLSPQDAFADASQGYIYGADPVSYVDLTIESIWLREWMGKLMPPDLQAARGTNGRTVDEAPAAAPAGAAPAEAPPVTSASTSG